MEKCIAESRLAKMIKQRNSWLTMGLGLLALSLIQTIIIYDLRNNQRTIITPPVLKEGFWVGHYDVSDEYLIEMSQFFAGQLLNVTPETYQVQKKQILKYVSPDSYGALKSKWSRDAKYIRQHQISSVFYPIDITVDRSNMSVKLFGVLRVMSGAAKPINRQVSYKIKFSYLSGKLWIKNFSEEKQDE